MQASEQRVVYSPRPDVTPEKSRDARARAWAFIFDSYRKKAAGTNGGEDAMRGSKIGRAT